MKGFIALTTVLIISAISLVIGLSTGLINISETDMGLQKSQSLKAYYLANLCAEQALIRLKEDVNYPGDESLNIDNGICTIFPIEGNWTIKVLGIVFNQTKKMKIIVSQVNPVIIIDSWQEVGDF